MTPCVTISVEFDATPQKIAKSPPVNVPGFRSAGLMAPVPPRNRTHSEYDSSPSLTDKDDSLHISRYVDRYIYRVARKYWPPSYNTKYGLF